VQNEILFNHAHGTRHVILTLIHLLLQISIWEIIVLFL